MNILILTPVYPTPVATNSPTKVVHYFAEEWQRHGENVRVINLPSYFFKWFYNPPKFIERFLNKRFGSAISKFQNKEIQEFDIDGIKTLSVPLFKLYPGAKVASRHIKRKLNIITNYLESSNFKPDVIVAHWTEPSLPFLAALKAHYKCPAVMVSHSNDIKFHHKDIPSVDLWGYRCISTVENFKKKYPQIEFGFRCCSGIPKIFLENIPNRDYNSTNRYIYVGQLLQRKYPDRVIDAVTKAHSTDSNYSLKIVGSGIMFESLKKQVKELGAEDKIKLTGRLDRDRIIEELDNSDIFIMISAGEVFGLVYLEAMARGCIVIASKGEGMEGIIKNGFNGFLVEAGNAAKLAETIKQIQELSPEERKRISINAFKTAKEMTDEKVAMDYLSVIQRLVSNK